MHQRKWTITKVERRCFQRGNLKNHVLIGGATKILEMPLLEVSLNTWPSYITIK